MKNEKGEGKMREITQLPNKVYEGRIGVEQLKSMLAFERKCAEPRLTMRTLEAFSADLENREAMAEAELDESYQAALRNIPIIEGLLLELGSDTITPPPVTRRANGYFSNENVEDGRRGFGL